jgi:hypothetical protein
MSLKLAAEKHFDELLLLRIRDVDLVAKGSVYHSACMSTYLTWKPNRQENDSIVSEHDAAFQRLINTIDTHSTLEVF